MKSFFTLCAILVAVLATTQAQPPPQYTTTTLGTTHAFLGQNNVVTDLGAIP